MALTYSSMLELGSDLKEFSLINSITNEKFHSAELESTKPTLIMFICNHCPYVIHYHQEIQKLATDYLTQFNFVAISSNDIENYPQDAPDKMKLLWNELQLNFPYLYDETQEVAKGFKAECTPEFYVFDINKKLVYRGRFDESSPGSEIDPSGTDVRKAMSALLEGKLISENQHPSMGCNIKWK